VGNIEDSQKIVTLIEAAKKAQMTLREVTKTFRGMFEYFDDEKRKCLDLVKGAEENLRVALSEMSFQEKKPVS